MMEPRRVALYCGHRQCRRLIGYAVFSEGRFSLEVTSKHGGHQHHNVLTVDADSGTLRVMEEQPGEVVIP